MPSELTSVGCRHLEITRSGDAGMTERLTEVEMVG